MDFLHQFISEERFEPTGELWSSFIGKNVKLSLLLRPTHQTTWNKALKLIIVGRFKVASVYIKQNSLK